MIAYRPQKYSDKNSNDINEIISKNSEIESIVIILITVITMAIVRKRKMVKLILQILLFSNRPAISIVTLFI